VKYFFLAMSLFALPSAAFGGTCSPQTPKHVPCSPKPGKATDDAKANILRSIEDAQRLETKVQLANSRFVAVRDNWRATKAQKQKACKEALDAQMSQEALYREAMDQTADLYHVWPKQRGRIVIGRPSDPAMSYTEDLPARWNPRPTDSGLGVKFAARIDGSDGQPHYSGGTNMDPNAPNGLLAATLSDGRVFVLKDTFTRTMKNPGLLAAILYHEARHFDRLSWKDKTGENRGWASADKEERDVYEAGIRYAKTLDLDENDIAWLGQKYQEYAKAVRTGKSITDSSLTPKQEADWKNYYEAKQLNLEDEYAALSQNISVARVRQMAAQKRDKEVRETRAARQRPLDERLRTAKADLSRQSCADPGSVTQVMLDSLPKAYDEVFAAKHPRALDPCESRAYDLITLGENAYTLLTETEKFRQARIAQERRAFEEAFAESQRREAMRREAEEVLRGSRRPDPPPSAYVPPPPISRSMPQLRDFAINACRAPDRVAIGMLLVPYYDHSYRAYDDRYAAELLSGLDRCSGRLFYRLIELLRADDWRQTDRRWLQETVAAYSTTPGSTAGNNAPWWPPSQGGGSEPVIPPPPPKHDPEGEALERLREIERRKRWGLRPVR